MSCLTPLATVDVLMISSPIAKNLTLNLAPLQALFLLACEIYGERGEGRTPNLFVRSEML